MDLRVHLAEPASHGFYSSSGTPPSRIQYGGKEPLRQVGFPARYRFFVGVDVVGVAHTVKPERASEAFEQLENTLHMHEVMHLVSKISCY